MKFILKSLLLLTALFTLNQATSQIELPQDMAKWKFSVEQGKDCEATIIAEVTIAPHWHINAIVLPKGVFGVATQFNLDKSPNYKLIGSVKEPKPIQIHDPVSDEDVAIHEGKVVFRQKIQILSKTDFVLNGSYGFQPCDESHCLFPYEAKFTVKVKGCADGTAQIEETDVENTAQTPVVTDKDENGNENTTTAVNEEKKNDKPVVAGKDDTEKSLWGTFFLAFFGGFAAIIMPCVFPMIPMTVSFFTKRSKTPAIGRRNAFIYGGSIIAIHVLLGGIVVVSRASSLLNEMSTNVYFNIFFFLMLFVFGLSFLGAFEIQLPSKWTNKADEKADKGGIVGIFFMALVLSLASFSCTGPILGSLLVGISSTGGDSALMVGMFAFGLALALPFMLFALFPSWLNSMPSSGGWLNVVKVFLGFLEIAFAFKFLSTADTTMQWHLLEREVFISIWIAVFGTLALYLLGKVRLPHDSPVEKLSVGRTMMATLTIAFTFYLIPGLWGAPLKLVNAFLPPDFYAESPKGFGGGGRTVSVSNAHTEDGMHEGPQGLMAFNDYDKALAYAKKVNKPLFVDFTGWGCVNCRKMEQSVWGEPGIIEHLRDDVVIVSLYVDERTELPKKEQRTIKVNGQDFSVTTIGNKWTAKQIEEYKTASQPYYVLQTPEGEDIPVGSADYQNHSSAKVFKKWLEDGLKMHKK
ncbi:Thiol:disulfide interchange protein DsbD precursor [compost metagenome]